MSFPGKEGVDLNIDSFYSSFIYLMGIFGSQNSEGQFYKNCYTQGKVRATLVPNISRYDWKGDRDLMLQVTAREK